MKRHLALMTLSAGALLVAACGSSNKDETDNTTMGEGGGALPTGDATLDSSLTGGGAMAPEGGASSGMGGATASATGGAMSGSTAPGGMASGGAMATGGTGSTSQ